MLRAGRPLLLAAFLPPFPASCSRPRRFAVSFHLEKRVLDARKWIRGCSHIACVLTCRLQHRFTLNRAIRIRQGLTGRNSFYFCVLGTVNCRGPSMSVMNMSRPRAISWECEVSQKGCRWPSHRAEARSSNCRSDRPPGVLLQAECL